MSLEFTPQEIDAYRLRLETDRQVAREAEALAREAEEKRVARQAKNEMRALVDKNLRKFAIRTAQLNQKLYP